MCLLLKRGGDYFMIKKIAIGTGVILTSAALAASVTFAQTDTTSPTSEMSPSPSVSTSPSMSPTTSPKLPSGAPATGHGL